MPRPPLKKINPEQLDRAADRMKKFYEHPGPERTDDQRMLAFMDSLERVHDIAAAEGNWKAQIACIKQAWEMLMDKQRKQAVGDKPDDEPDVSHLSDEELKAAAK